jgi:hypothetical protein
MNELAKRQRRRVRGRGGKDNAALVRMGGLDERQWKRIHEPLLLSCRDFVRMDEFTD